MSETIQPPKLTPKQARFVEEYLIDLNATQAAIRAGYSPKTAYSIGQRLLKNVEIQAAIQEARGKISEEIQLNRQDILVGLLSEANYTDVGASHGARVSAWREIAKILGFYEIDNSQKGNADLMTRKKFVEDMLASISGKTVGLPTPRKKELSLMNGENP